MDITAPSSPSKRCSTILKPCYNVQRIKSLECGSAISTNDGESTGGESEFASEVALPSIFLKRGLSLTLSHTPEQHLMQTSENSPGSFYLMNQAILEERDQDLSDDRVIF